MQNIKGIYVKNMLQCKAAHLEVFLGGTSLTHVQTKDLIEKFDFKIVAGQKGISRNIRTSHISRPGIEMAGFFHLYAQDRLQVIGRKEMTFFLGLTDEEQDERFKRLCTEKTPGIIVACQMDIPSLFIQHANATNIPLLQTYEPSTRVISKLTDYLEGQMSPKITKHGVFVDIYGIGVL